MTRFQHGTQQLHAVFHLFDSVVAGFSRPFKVMWRLWERRKVHHGTVTLLLFLMATDCPIGGFAQDMSDLYDPGQGMSVASCCAHLTQKSQYSLCVLTSEESVGNESIWPPCEQNQ